MNTHGASTRKPVYSGTRRVPGLYERTLADGATVYDAALRLGGKVRRYRLEATTKTDAIAEVRALHVDYTRGEVHKSPAAGASVADVASDWLAHLETRIGHRDPKRRYSARTVALYRQKCESYLVPELGARHVPEISVTDVRRLVDRLGAAGLAPSTVTGTLGILSGLLRYAMKSGLVDRNVVRDLDRDDRPGVGRLTEPRYLTADELASVLANMTDTFRPVAAMCMYAGLRISEALGLRWRDLDFKTRTLTASRQLGTDGDLVPLKTASSAATIPLLPALARELREHRSRQASRDLRLVHSDALVFTTTRGKAQSRRNALRALHVAGDKAGLNGEGREPVGLHDLRHSYVALALGATSIGETASLARHANPKVTLAVYGGIVDDGREKAAAKLVEAGFGA